MYCTLTTCADSRDISFNHHLIVLLHKNGSPKSFHLIHTFSWLFRFNAGPHGCTGGELQPTGISRAGNSIIRQSCRLVHLGSTPRKLIAQAHISNAWVCWDIPQTLCAVFKMLLAISVLSIRTLSPHSTSSIELPWQQYPASLCVKRDEVKLCCKLKQEDSHENGLGGCPNQSERSVA